MVGEESNSGGLTTLFFREAAWSSVSLVVRSDATHSSRITTPYYFSKPQADVKPPEFDSSPTGYRNSCLTFLPNGAWSSVSLVVRSDATHSSRITTPYYFSKPQADVKPPEFDSSPTGYRNSCLTFLPNGAWSSVSLVVRSDATPYWVDFWGLFSRTLYFSFLSL